MVGVPDPHDSGRAAHTTQILDAAEERDGRAELRDRVAEERERAASLRSFLPEEKEEM